jgi:hypothetical protein
MDNYERKIVEGLFNQLKTVIEQINLLIGYDDGKEAMCDERRAKLYIVDKTVRKDSKEG